MSLAMLESFFADLLFISRCQRYLPLSFSIGAGLGPRTFQEVELSAVVLECSFRLFRNSTRFFEAMVASCLSGLEMITRASLESGG